MAKNVLSKANTNAKTLKSEKFGKYEGMILYLSPQKSSGLGNLCPFASLGCVKTCLNTAGRGIFPSVQKGRLRKTKLFFKNKPLFFETLHKELTALGKRAAAHGRKAFVRLNGTSDIRWETFRPYDGKTVFQEFQGIQFYDYTKDLKKALMIKNAGLGFFDNYHITFSLSEKNSWEALEALEHGINTAVVFRKEPPTQWKGYKVINGDEYDLRFLEGYQGLIVGLKAKGKARKDKSGFVVQP